MNIKRINAAASVKLMITDASKNKYINITYQHNISTQQNQEHRTRQTKIATKNDDSRPNNSVKCKWITA